VKTNFFTNFSNIFVPIVDAEGKDLTTSRGRNSECPVMYPDEVTRALTIANPSYEFAEVDERTAAKMVAGGFPSIVLAEQCTVNSKCDNCQHWVEYTVDGTILERCDQGIVTAGVCDGPQSKFLEVVDAI
jgi:hypothetical protein